MKPGITKLAIVSALAMGLALPAAARRPIAKKQRPRVEVVFALDTTGSMGGLIEGAKRKIWSIVDEIARGKPTPEIRLGLVAYRDRGDNYVTQVTPLTDDLDAVYEKLMQFRADGGGDGPEDVNSALRDALNRMNWTQGRSVLKTIFLVGDAPPHMDYNDVPSYKKTVKRAITRDISVNAIQCGNWAETTTVWQQIADRGEGSFVALAQDGGTVAVATPYDKELSKLSGELSDTHMAYGKAEERKAAKAKVRRAEAVAGAAAPMASADRASYRARTGTVGRSDLLEAMDKDGVALDDVAEEELPEPMKTMKPAARKAFVEKKQKERAELRQQISELSKKRDAFIKDEMKKKGAGRDAFDEKVIEAIRAKAEEKGIDYE